MTASASSTPPSEGHKVAVTGATGLVGKSLVTYLLGQGYGVVAVGRSRSRLDELGREFKSNFEKESESSLETRLADVSDLAALEEAFRGCDAVVHSAGSVDPYGAREEIFSINHGGTKNALAAASTAGVKHFIQISSLSVITGQGDQYNVDESTPLKPCGESYADSKVEAEREVMNNAPAGLEVTSLRPGFIYGPGERAWMPRVINSIATGKAMLIDGGKKDTNVIYVENLSRAVEKAILNPVAYGQAYNLTDGEKISKKRLFDAIADGMGLPRVTRVVPAFIARAACETVSSIAPYLSADKQRSLSRFSRAAFRLAGVNQGFSINKAEKELGYTNRIGFDQGMKRTLDSFKKAERSEAGSLETAGRQ